ncbi:MAG TPA: grasp-with-spasm system SPASM domain peptide maturase [Chitinophaga sp.]|uniref:grasp-with-spasm system SPASM domain peptide maturase n=1 Tax=Chitinophaga sp. TaxID=1869181 RepID=UPI002BE17217|nr:grasp-with-spasm system SPASM domain peptide maturase [Chitinophaga sp.]HVI47532.1 grasp-with-spasm system SPASM domain peptide maturase [Chitinophaga sp.]
MLDVHIPFKLFSTCFLVKGAARSAICDTQRETLHLIPNELYTILFEFDGRPICDILQWCENDNEEVVAEYFEFLYNNELIFFTRIPELFSAIPLDYEEARAITNAIVDPLRDILPWDRIACELSALGCGHLQIRCFSEWGISDLIYALSRFDETRIRSVDLILMYTAYGEEAISILLRQFPRVTSVYFHSAPTATCTHEGIVVYLTEVISSADHCGIVSPDYFAVNIKMFSESQRHNTCLNRKISIDVKGEIRNCPSLSESFGNIRTTSLSEAVKHPGFKKYWDITKDQIVVCKDCEFRHVCTDCRAFTQDQDALNKPLKCGYDPYSCEWSNWKTKDLIQYEIKFL